MTGPATWPLRRIASPVPAATAGRRVAEHPPLDRVVPVVLYADEWGGVGGTAGYIVMLGRELRRRGYRVAAICDPSERVAWMRECLTECGADVRAVTSGDGSVRGRLKRHRRLTAVFRDYPGCILALMMGYFTRGGGPILAARMGRAGAVVRVDLTPPEPPYRARERLALRVKDRLTDRIVVGAVENRQAFARRMGRREQQIDVVHTGIDLGRFQPGQGRTSARAELGYARGDVVVGTAARLDDDRKGLHDFIAMAGRVGARFPAARFLIVGDGVLREGLARQAEREGVGKRVTFAGWRSDVPRMLAAMDVFVMSSLFEGGPTSVLEAMAMALPVIATRVGMVPEVIADGDTGFLVPPGDAGAMTARVASLLADSALRAVLGAAAGEEAGRNFSVDLMVDRYLRVFAAAMRQRPRA